MIKARGRAQDLSKAGQHVRAEDGVEIRWSGEEKLKSAGKDERAFEAIREGLLAGCNRIHPKGYPLINIEIDGTSCVFLFCL